VEKAFGSKRPKVKATIDGIPYRGTLVRTPALAPGASVGTECHLLLILKSIREQTGKTFGDEVHLTVEADTSPRVIELPEGLKRAFQTEKEAKAFFREAVVHPPKRIRDVDQRCEEGRNLSGACHQND